MLTLKTNIAIVILIGAMLLSSAITYTITVSTLQHNQKAKQEAVIKSFHKDVTIPTTDGRRW